MIKKVSPRHDSHQTANFLQTIQTPLLKISKIDHKNAEHSGENTIIVHFLFQLKHVEHNSTFFYTTFIILFYFFGQRKEVRYFSYCYYYYLLELITYYCVETL
jgi:hypothetical protein